MASLTIKQTASHSDGVFTAVDTVTESSGINKFIFVHKVTDDTFSHYASLTDMLSYPTTKEEAKLANLGFYRKDVASRKWPSISDLLTQQTYTQTRARSLLIAWDAYVADFLSEKTVVISTGE